MEQSADFYFKQSQENFSKGDIAEGFADLDRAIQLAPDNLEYRWERGKLKYQQEEYDLANEDFTKIIELSGDIDEVAEARSKRAHVLEALGLYYELILDLDWLIVNGSGDNASLYNWRGHHNLLLGRSDEAIRDFTKAHEIAPQFSDILLQRANAYYQAKRYDEAIQDLTQILNSDENQPDYLAAIYDWRGRAFYRSNKLQEALTDFNQMQRLRGSAPFSSASDYMNSIIDLLYSD